MCKAILLYTYFLGELMDKNIENALLYDAYAKILTEKQRDLFEEYYLFNLSLREIAENKKISYQAVRDSIKKSENLLKEYEEKIGMLRLRKKISNIKKVCHEDSCGEMIKKSIILEMLSEDDN